MSVIDGIKLIKHNRQRIDLPDDPSHPFRLRALFRPEYGLDAGIVAMMGGREELVVRGKTAEALLEFMRRNGYIGHPRVIDLSLTGPIKIPTS